MPGYRRFRGQWAMRQLAHMAHVLFARKRRQYEPPGPHVSVRAMTTALYAISAMYSHGLIVLMAWRIAALIPAA